MQKTVQKIKSITTRFGFSFFMAGLYAFFYIPLTVLIVFSFNSKAFPAPWTQFTTHWYSQLWHHSDQLWQALGNSFIVAVGATLLALLLGITFVFSLVKESKLSKLVPIFYANLVVPEIVLAVGLLSVFTIFSIPLGRVTLIMVHTVLGLGYAVPLLYSRYQELDKRLIEASLDLGASRTQTFFKVIFPLIRSTLLISGLLVFIISFDDFVLSYFCAGTSAQTLPLYLISMLRTGVSPVANALSTGLLLLIGSVVIVASVFNLDLVHDE